MLFILFLNKGQVTATFSIETFDESLQFKAMNLFILEEIRLISSVYLYLYSFSHVLAIRRSHHIMWGMHLAVFFIKHYAML